LAFALAGTFLPLGQPGAQIGEPATQPSVTGRHPTDIGIIGLSGLLGLFGLIGSRRRPDKGPDHT
jgi:hypothetical protein